MPRVLLVEDDGWVRDAVAATLERAPGYPLAGAFDRVAATIAAVAGGLAFDLALVDLGLPDGDGIQLIRRLRVLAPQAALVAFTVHDDPPRVLAALRAGARGYLLKSTSPGRLVEALAEAAAGGTPLSGAVARHLVGELTDEADQPPLTPREADVLRLLARGLSYADAARLLGIQLGTLQGYVKAVYAKLEVSSKAEAAARAVKLGLS